MVIPAAPPLTFEERAPHENGFAAHFDQHIRPRLDEIERRRLEEKKKRSPWYTLGKWLVSIIIYLSAILLFYSTVENRFILYTSYALGISLLVLYFLWNRYWSGEYALNRKPVLVPLVLNFLGDFKFAADGEIPETVLSSSKLFGSWSIYQCRDLISGTHESHAFEFGEIKLERMKRMGEGFAPETVFEGICIAVRLSVPTDHQTFAVASAGGPKDWLRGLMESDPGLNQVPFEDATSQNQFDVYSTDEAEARRLITPEAIEAAINLGRIRNAGSVEFGFTGDWFVLKLATDHDVFYTSSIDATALTTEDSRAFLEELHEVLQIVETIGTATV